MNKVEDIKLLTADGIEFADGRSLETEVGLVLPNWKPHDFLRGLPISDEVGLIMTDMTMRNPGYPNVLACGAPLASGNCSTRERFP